MLLRPATSYHQPYRAPPRIPPRRPLRLRCLANNNNQHRGRYRVDPAAVMWCVQQPVSRSRAACVGAACTTSGGVPAGVTCCRVNSACHHYQPLKRKNEERGKRGK
ncbi:hypothetical protein O3P69_011038 [Scylla paramamosain]|uniref:Uncharacterized protein n=1 Tax=Scylla paramamosain TaxID=85552 RepID=A0AAW0SS87_SCYPA